MARLIDAEPIIKRWNTESLGRKEMYDMVRNAPTIDAVPVVRCKDCVYRCIKRDPIRNPMGWYGCKVMHYNEDDWFCSFGERRDDELQKDDGRCELPCAE